MGKQKRPAMVAVCGTSCGIQHHNSNSKITVLHSSCSKLKSELIVSSFVQSHSCTSTFWYILAQSYSKSTVIYSFHVMETIRLVFNNSLEVVKYIDFLCDCLFSDTIFSPVTCNSRKEPYFSGFNSTLVSSCGPALLSYTY